MTQIIFARRLIAFTQEDGGFYRLNNAADMGGAYMTPGTFQEFAKAVARAAGVALVEDQPTPAAAAPRTRSYADLSDQAKLVLQHIRRAGSISAREAMNDHGITSATLARRVCDLEEAGFALTRERKVHPITGKRYTRYALVD